MTIHYHGLPITPNRVLHTLGGAHFCVSYMRPEQVEWADRYGQSLMIDNGAYSAWRKGLTLDGDHWRGFYDFADRWLDRPTTWAVIPDVIDAGTQEQDALIREWPWGQRGAPVWHMDEPIDRLIRLLDDWPRVCVGSTAEFAKVGSDPWRHRMDDAWDQIAARFARTPVVHMLRGMQCVRWGYPFASVDSTDVAQSHWRPQKVAATMVKGWDLIQCPARYEAPPRQATLFDQQGDL